MSLFLFIFSKISLVISKRVIFCFRKSLFLQKKPFSILNNEYYTWFVKTLKIEVAVDLV